MASRHLTSAITCPSQEKKPECRDICGTLIGIGECAGLGAVDPAQGLAFLSAVLSGSCSSALSCSQFLSHHYVYSPFLINRLLAAEGRRSSFFDAMRSPPASLQPDPLPALVSRGAATAASADPGQGHLSSTSRSAQLPDVASTVSRLAQEVLGCEIMPTQPLMEVRAMQGSSAAVIMFSPIALLCFGSQLCCPRPFQLPVLMPMMSGRKTVVACCCGLHLQHAGQQ